jgi:hypothetical protein
MAFVIGRARPDSSASSLAARFEFVNLAEAAKP